jgi:hypothetical protein
MSRQYRFICAVAGGKFLAVRPRGAPWPYFADDVGSALKFRSEEEAEAWLRKNGNPRVWLEQHTQTLHWS